MVVLDNASGDVLAYVGGIGGNSTAAAVDGANAYRQAGSTLKPFLYAQAIEKGYLTAASILDDSPVQLDTASGLYVPQNYDKGFKGPVSVRSALAGSLNVPAVRTLLLVGVDAFRDRLWDTGYQGLVEDGDYYGYSLALGSAEVTLLEQADAYRSLANGGRWSPLRLTADDPRPAAARDHHAASRVDRRQHDGRPQCARGDVRARFVAAAAVLGGGEDRHVEGDARQLVRRLFRSLHRRGLGRERRGRCDARGVGHQRRGAGVARRDARAARRPAEPRAGDARRGSRCAPIAYAGNIEQPRREYFLQGHGA